MEKVLIGMSGGVDSSVAAALLVEAGYEVIGITFKLFDAEELLVEGPSRCCSVDDIMDAKMVCGKLGIPHYVVNMMELFREEVVDSFVEGYRCGKTPNPCITCNRVIKFGAFLKIADELGARYIATGHYVRVEENERGEYLLKKGLYTEKDQSYMLYTLTQEVLARVLMPLGELSKEKVREIAKARELPVAKKAESQDICFVPDGKYTDFLANYGKVISHKGNFVDTKGEIIGEHNGYFYYTIGQRRGLGQGFNKRLYVLETRPKENEVVLGEREELLTREVHVRDVNWILPPENDEIICEVRLRYSQEPQVAKVLCKGDDVSVYFENPVKLGAPGQAAVFYHDEIVLGGGEIFISES